MALLHEHLYKSKNFSQLNIKQYLQELIESLKISYSFNATVRVKLNSEDIYISFEKAIPLGLVVNELVSNSMKHAFPYKLQKESAKIEIACRRFNDTKLFLSVSDNGVGLSEEFDIHNTTSLGMQIVYNIIENQLDGDINLVHKQGPCFNMCIPL